MKKLLIIFLSLFLSVTIQSQIIIGTVASSVGIGTGIILVTDITVTGEGEVITITTDNGTLQMFTAILPVNATNQTVTWSIANGTGSATISETGLVTAVTDGTVTARATANDGSAVFGELEITISNQVAETYGPELIEDTGLDDQSGYWYTFGAWDWTDGYAAIINGGTGDNYFVYYNDALYTIGKTYHLVYILEGVSGSGVRVGINSTDLDDFKTTDGIYTIDILCTTVDRPYCDVYPGGTTSAHVIYISIKEVL